jgi:hypothetical protein
VKGKNQKLSAWYVQQETVRHLVTPKGTVKVIVPRGATFREAGQAMLDAFEAISARHRARKKTNPSLGEQLDDLQHQHEELRLLNKTEEGIPTVVLRTAATHKLKDTRQFRKRLKRKKARSQKLFFKNPLHEFIRVNWHWLVTVKNPKYKDMRG